MVGANAITVINNMNRPNFDIGLFVVAIGIFLFMGFFAYGFYRFKKWRLKCGKWRKRKE